MRASDTPAAVSAWRLAGKQLTRLEKAKLRAFRQAGMRRINALARNPAQAKQLWRAIDWRRRQLVQAPRQAKPSVRNQAGALVCDERRVCAALREPFATLGSLRPPMGQGFDETWRAEVEAEVAHFADLAGAESGVLDDSITEAEVEAAIRSAKCTRPGCVATLW